MQLLSSICAAGSGIKNAPHSLILINAFLCAATMIQFQHGPFRFAGKAFTNDINNGQQQKNTLDKICRSPQRC